MQNDWNPIFYVVFIPVFAGALYLVICVIGGVCSREARARARAQRAQRDAALAAIQAAETPKAARRAARTGPDFLRPEDLLRRPGQV
jgi:hypothetical protein